MTEPPATLDASLHAPLSPRFSLAVDGLRAGGEPGPVTALIGPSGAGKTSVLRGLAGLLRPRAGHVHCAGETWFDGASAIHVPTHRRRLGMLFQDHALFPHLTVADNVAFGLRHLPRTARRARAMDWLDRLAIADLADRRPAALSGGQQQRAALARAMAREPHLPLLDEPLAALDPPLRLRLRAELRRVIADAGIPTLLVTHDRAEAIALGDRVGVMAHGRLLQLGAGAEVFARPANLEVAAIVGTDCVVLADVTEVAAGVARLRAGHATISAAAPTDLGPRAFACIRAEDVLLQRQPPQPSSARNRLHGRVTRIDTHDHLLRVTVDCGVELAALVTRSAREELDLQPGTEVWALVKATAIHLVPAPTGTGESLAHTPAC